ncbi:hypothetical protein Q9295_10010 [Xinfangfangia sp. CPCC 101601]|uniref:YARHG domain-containing protein n=1 Tax=Pseudogemmobacter lacusdianii TaxID=3069608 RepID=A0ABU0VY84_9RHOB|nr:hypothetical protein [Xinfangfangia sp. CPCC 101601]MDQ2066711.1 hypothetical protein [Xinfangfangia sp. CPCC 101601]
MKKITLTLTMALALAGSAVRANEQPQFVNFDGCEGKLVEGTNYYNFVEPGCKTYSRIHGSTPGEDKREEMRQAKQREQAAKK